MERMRELVDLLNKYALKPIVCQVLGDPSGNEREEDPSPP